MSKCKCGAYDVASWMATPGGEYHGLGHCSTDAVAAKDRIATLEAENARLREVVEAAKALDWWPWSVDEGLKLLEAGATRGQVHVALARLAKALAALSTDKP